MELSTGMIISRVCPVFFLGLSIARRKVLVGLSERMNAFEVMLKSGEIFTLGSQKEMLHP